MSNLQKKASEDYTSDNFEVLEGLDPVRVRPGMYIGDTSSPEGFHHMGWEIIDNSVDEALAGFATEIFIKIYPDNSCEVFDNGRGLPIDMHKEKKVIGAELIMTTLHAGGKFNQKSYQYSGGLHGVGASVVNALSSKLDLTIFKNEKVWNIQFENGYTKTPFHEVREIKENDIFQTGTKTRFTPNPKVFDNQIWNKETLTTRLSEITWLCPNLTIHFEDLRDNTKETWKHGNGVIDFTKFLNKDLKTIPENPIFFTFDNTKLKYQIAFNWIEEKEGTIKAFTNIIPQKIGGHHVAGFEKGLWAGFNTWINLEYNGKKKPEFTQEDFKYSLNGVISLYLDNPKFSSQTKEKLVSPETYQILQNTISEKFHIWCEENPENAKNILNIVLQSAHARLASLKARQVVFSESSIQQIAKNNKLDDCHEKDPRFCELFIVEGDSAAGTVKTGRNRHYQAVLPLKGKILNIEKKIENSENIFASESIGTLINALKCGIPFTPEFNTEKVKYHKIIITTDADVDGSHIECLLLTFFYRFYPDLIKKGYIQIAQPPLYKIQLKNESLFLKDDEELQDYILKVATKDIEFPFENNDPTSYIKNLFKIHQKIQSIFEKTRIPKEILDIFADQNKEKNIQECLKHLNNEDCHYEFKDKILFKKSFGTIEKFENIENFFPDNHTEIFGKILKQKEKKTKILGPYHFVETLLKNTKNITINRFKGLGEMNDTQLWETTLDPKKRTLRIITLEDAQKEAERFVVDLMGENVEGRKNFISQSEFQGNF